MKAKGRRCAGATHGSGAGPLLAIDTTHAHAHSHAHARTDRRQADRRGRRPFEARSRKEKRQVALYFLLPPSPLPRSSEKRRVSKLETTISAAVFRGPPSLRTPVTRARTRTPGTRTHVQAHPTQVCKVPAHPRSNSQSLPYRSTPILLTRKFSKKREEFFVQQE